MNDLYIRGSGESGIAGKRVQENFRFATTKKFFLTSRMRDILELRDLSTVGRRLPVGRW